MSCGLYYKHITIINGAFKVISEWHNNLEHQLRQRQRLRLFIVQASLTIVTYACHNIFIVQATSESDSRNYVDNRRAHIRHQCRKTTLLGCHRCLINIGVEQNVPHYNIDKNFDRQMSLSKRECWYSNKCLYFFKACHSIV